MNICALSTAQGGAIAIIRTSGPDAITIVNKLFSKDISEAKGQSLHYGRIGNFNDEADDANAEVIDDVVLSVYRAPHSYTGENAVEISCHGSRYIIGEILRLLIENGCRQALPGEFTQRAFMNGKMDLSQAEAVADLISSTNAATHRMAMSQLRGNFSSELALLRDRLLKLTSLMELELDFSDHEDLEFADRSQLLDISRQISERLSRLRDSFATGQALKNGIPVAIVGKTNVGKSTLLNRLLREEKAIVSDIHGTTRDVIEDTINIRGIDFRFIDTAGLRETSDEIERLGIERTRQKMRESTIILHLADDPRDFKDSKDINDLNDSQDFKASKDLNALNDPQDWVSKATKDLNTPKLLKVLTKIDQPPAPELPGILPISAKENINIDRLEEALVKAADIPAITENDVIVTSLRHYEALTSASAAIGRVMDGMQQGIPSDLLSEDLRDCLAALSEIVGGAITTDEVLGNIFAHFCVGK